MEKGKKRGPKTSIQIKSLQKADLLSLLKYHSLEEIGKKYGVATSSVSKALTDVFKKKDLILRSNNKEMQDEIYIEEAGKLHINGAWKFSDERRFMVQNNLMEYQNK